MQRVRDQDDCERDHRQRDPGLLQPQLAFVGHGPKGIRIRADCGTSGSGKHVASLVCDAMHLDAADDLIPRQEPRRPLQRGAVGREAPA